MTSNKSNTRTASLPSIIGEISLIRAELWMISIECALAGVLIEGLSNSKMVVSSETLRPSYRMNPLVTFERCFVLERFKTVLTLVVAGILWRKSMLGRRETIQSLISMNSIHSIHLLDWRRTSWIKSTWLFMFFFETKPCWQIGHENFFSPWKEQKIKTQFSKSNRFTASNSKRSPYWMSSLMLFAGWFSLECFRAIATTPAAWILWRNR